ANRLSFSDFLAAYDDVVSRAREGKLQIPDFQGTTISLTNPGTIGTVASTPRLMAGQSVIIATGAIEFPAEYQSIHPSILPQLGISKAITITASSRAQSQALSWHACMSCCSARASSMTRYFSILKFLIRRFAGMLIAIRFSSAPIKHTSSRFVRRV